MCKLTFWIWFQLFNGTFASILERTGNNVKVLQQRLEHFYVRVSVNNYPFLALKTWCWIMITSWICIACYHDTTSSIACVKFLQTLRLPQGDILDIFSGIDLAFMIMWMLWIQPSVVFEVTMVTAACSWHHFLLCPCLTCMWWLV